ncbi:MAG: hypothetical protein Phog2KO_36890 [Phototrophicaceae bacterium]
MDVGALVNQQYTVIEHIGRGGMADVWSARDTRLRRMVAIKTIVTGLGKDIDPVDLFKREAHTIAQMEHPHILPVYDFGEFDNNLYIVMRYVTGGSLEDTLRDGPMPASEVLRMGDAIGKALDYAHENNVIHLDLKPPNILLDSSDSPYLADFGLATVLDPEGRARNPGSGTLLYMAPEQMISETIDHRADIYAFCIMMFHMLTGKLPFEGSTPLSMSQVQRDIGLPSLNDYVADIPHEVTELLRLGTNQDPKYRPETHMDVMNQFRSIIQPSGITLASTLFEDDYKIEADPYNMLTEPYEGDIQDADLLEAIDIYTRARYDWQGGQGRFLMGVTNFIFISEYYQNADIYNLTIDTVGYQVLLRGAIEYDYELEYWWHQLGDDDRRWVCLHALRSGNTPARIRSLYRLETLPDEDGTAVIPRLVAQALEVEADNNAKLAALKVLGTRSRLMKKRHNVEIMTEYRGRLLSSMTRLGIEVSPASEWQESVYSDDVDVLVAEQAFDPNDDVAEFAARTVGKIRSLKAVTHLSQEQQNQRNGALQALAYVRDEAPSLPNVVKRDARFYAWITNTVRRLTEDPVQTMARIALVFIAGWLAMGVHIWSYFRVDVGSLGNIRWANTLGLGISFALLMATTYLLTMEISRRLQGFWAWWLRLLLVGVLGYAMTTLSFASFRYLFILEPTVSILWDEMRFAGAALAFALVATSLLRLSGWQGLLLTIIATFTPIYATYSAYYYPQQSTIVPIALIALILGVFCGWRASQLTAFDFDNRFMKMRFIPIVIGVVLGLGWTVSNWAVNFALLDRITSGNPFDWDIALYMMAINVLVGIVIAYWLNHSSRIGFLLTAIISFIGAYAVFAWQFFDYTTTIPLIQPAFEVLYSEGTTLLPITAQPIFNYDLANLNQIFTLTLPMVIVIALGMNMPELLSGWWHWIGKEQAGKERGAWLAFTLGYVMVLTALVSVLTLYSPEVNRIWELSWSFWAFVTFVLALATYRWAKWGANGLLISGILLLIGGVAFDIVEMFREASNGIYPSLFSPVPQIQTLLSQIGLDVVITASQFWVLWLLVLAIFVWGAQKRSLWGGIGLVALIVGWIVIYIASPIKHSVAVFTATNVALVIYVLYPKYSLMENNRLDLSAFTAGNSATELEVPATVIHHNMPLPPAPATQIFAGMTDQNVLTDNMQTKTAMTEVAYDINYDDAIDMDTVAPIQINPEDLHTQVSSETDFADTSIANDLTNIKINLDTSSLDMNTEPSPEKANTELTDIKINLDTSSLNMNTEPSPEKSNTGLTDIKINLDTSSLNMDVEENPDAPNANSLNTEIAPRSTEPPITSTFTFDISDVINNDTVKFDDNTEQSDDDSEDDE